MRFIKTLIIGIICLAVLIIGVMFSIHNTEEVGINLIFIQLPKASLSVWLITTFLLGGIAGISLSALTILMLKTRLGSSKRKINNIQKELDQLRITNLKDVVQS